MPHVSAIDFTNAYRLNAMSRKKLSELLLILLIHGTCLGLVFYILTNGITRYFKGETRALTTLKRTKDESFIAFTVCGHPK